MASARPAGFICIESIVAKLRLHELPAGAPELLDETTPLFGRERWSWPRGRLQLDSVRQGLRRSPFGEPDFADGKGGNETEFVRGRVERIPERLEHASAFLGEHLFSPNGFINLSFPGFKRLDTGRKLVADPAARTPRL